MAQDVLIAMESLSHSLGGAPLGKDTTGVIRRIGSNVRNVEVGDRIFGLAPRGSITDRLILPSSLAVKLPEDLTFEDAATMPCCFATAIHSLLNVGRITKGQVRLRLLTHQSDQNSRALFLSTVTITSKLLLTRISRLF